MCIVFIHVDYTNSDMDYKLIVISNRDELYDRPAQKMGPWCEDTSVYGGRGKIVENFVTSDLKTSDFVESMKDYFQQCNEFVLVAIEFRSLRPVIQTYNNANNELKEWNDNCLGFSNSLPENPLKKVVTGKCKLQDCCNKYYKLEDKEKLIEELINILKSEERNLPDQQLEQRQPHHFKELSSIFVKMPSRRYGTRAHTIILVSKTGKMNLIEISMKSSMNLLSPCWERAEFEFNLAE